MVLPQANGGGQRCAGGHGAGCQGARPMRARRAGCRAHPLCSDAVRAEDAPVPVPVPARRRWTRCCLQPPQSGVRMLCRRQQCGRCGCSAAGRDRGGDATRGGARLAWRAWHQKSGPGPTKPARRMQRKQHDRTHRPPCVMQLPAVQFAAVVGAGAQQVSRHRRRRVERMDNSPTDCRSASSLRALVTIASGAMGYWTTRQVDRSSASTQQGVSWHWRVLHGQQDFRRSTWGVHQVPSDCTEVAPHRAARSKASSVMAPVSTVGRIAGGAPGP